MVMLAKVALVSGVALLGWAFQATRPPPPAILGGPGGPPVTSSRIQLKDGRHLAYREAGVAREAAKYKVIFFHGFGSTKESDFPVSQELVEELGIYLLFFDRAGYGDSDANPKRSLKSDATDVEELADALQLGEKLYVVGTSMGAYTVWSCLNYIPHRLAGAALVVPAVNYWWPLPANVSASAYGKLHVADRRTFWIAHNMPWLFYAWMTQKWFRISPIVSGQREAFTDQDWEIATELQRKQQESGEVDQGKATQQGIYESLCRDATILFSTWEFDPTKIKNPFPNGEGVVSIWQGHEDKIVRVEVQRYVAQQLPWIRYHEHPEGGHLFLFMDGMGDRLIRELVLGEEPQEKSIRLDSSTAVPQHVINTNCSDELKAYEAQEEQVEAASLEAPEDQDQDPREPVESLELVASDGSSTVYPRGPSFRESGADDNRLNVL